MILIGECGNLLILCSPMTSLIWNFLMWNFPCLLHLPSPNLEWLLLSLVSLCTLCSRPVYKNTVPHTVELTYLLVSVVSVTFYRSIHSGQGKNTQEMRVLKPGGCNTWGKGDGNENVYPEECRIIWGVGGQVVGLGYTYSFKDFKQGSWPGYYFKWSLGVDLRLMGEQMKTGSCSQEGMCASWILFSDWLHLSIWQVFCTLSTDLVLD